MTEINFKQLRQDATTVIKGDFVATIVEAEAVQNSKGNPMIKTKWKIIAGPYEGRPLYNNFNITPDSPAALRMFFNHMEVLGLGEEFFDRNPSPSEIAQQLVGAAATVTVGGRMWQGTEREEIQGVKALPPGLGGATGASGGVVPQSIPQSLPTGLPTTVTVPPTTETLGKLDLNATGVVTSSDATTSTEPEPELPF